MRWHPLAGPMSSLPRWPRRLSSPGRLSDPKEPRQSEQSVKEWLAMGAEAVQAAPNRGRHDHAALGSSVAADLDAEVSDLRRELGRLRSQTRGSGEAFRRSIEERIVVVENQSDELEARITARVEGELTSRFAMTRDTNRQHEELRRGAPVRHEASGADEAVQSAE